MAHPEHNTPAQLLAQLNNDLETIDCKMEIADANENVIERAAALERLSEKRDWLMAEIAAILQYKEEQP